MKIDKDKTKTVNMYAESGRYLQQLPPKKQRDAGKLDEHFEDVKRIFLW